jgi:hypothetical protein
LSVVGRNGGSWRLRRWSWVCRILGNRAEIRRGEFRQALRCGGRLGGGGPHIFVGRGGDQVGLLRGEGPAVAVHELLAGAGALHVEVGENRRHRACGGYWLIRPGPVLA